MEAAGVPVVPGVSESLGDIEAACRTAGQIGYPVMLKASAGGGGIGMQRVENEEALKKAYEGNKKRASDFFGDGSMYIEKVIEHARHIEVQLLPINTTIQYICLNVIALFRGATKKSLKKHRLHL